MTFNAGAAPGSLIIDANAPRTRIRVVAYSPDRLEERSLDTVAELEEFAEHEGTLWVDVAGLGDAETLIELGERFGLHRLVLEDVVNVGQRPKVESYDDHLFVVATLITDSLPEQLSLVLGKSEQLGGRVLLTFQERPGDCFGGVRERLRRGRPTIRRSGPDYLAYALLDALVDAYFPVVQSAQEDVERLEKALTSSAAEDCVSKIHHLKSRLLQLRRILTPQREAFNSLVRDADGFIEADTAIHLRDCYDHLLRLIELVEVAREQCSDLLNLYLSIQSNRMNEVMKVLTIIATIFIPLSFVAGLYGMNFDPQVSPWNMPELGWRYGYPAALLVMAAIAVALLALFWRRGWFRS